MKKPSASKKSRSPAKTKPDSLSGLLTEVRQLIQSARRGVATVVDTFQVMTNFEIGRRIVEHEQKGAKRAAYGDLMLSGLAEALTAEFGRGYSMTNLKLMRQFFVLFRDRIGQTLSGESAPATIGQQATDQFRLPEKGQQAADQLTILQQPAEKLIPAQVRQQATGKSPFTLSWTHYVVLLTIKDPDERSFYEIEATNAGWSVPELKRQKASCLYERLALSRDKAGIRKLAKEGQIIVRAEDLLKEPLVLEFLGLEEKSGYSENDLEQAIIDRLEHFLLELGKGFLFEARQKRFSFDEDHYFVDLVFYNRLLRCYVIIDLHPVRYPHQTRIARRTPLSHGVKLDKATHQDLGQMQIYPVRYEPALRLCPSKPRRRQFLRRIHQRPETSFHRTRSGSRAVHPKPVASRTGVLRGLPQSGRRHKAGEVSQDGLGQTIHQIASRRLSHGVNVNYYDREVKLPEENPTIGLLLCKSAKKTVVELTLPKDANIHAKEPECSGDRLPQAARRASAASQYQLYLPSKELLKQKLDEWSAAASR